MHLELNDDDALTLRELLQERVTQLDKQIGAAESLRFKDELKNEERRIERILGAIDHQTSRGPEEWEVRDNIPDVPPT